MTGARVLIAHDWLVAWAGSERCVEQMLEVFPDADLVVGVMVPSLRDYNGVTRRATETWLSRIPGARRHHRWFLPLEGLAFATLDTRPYDLVISSSHAFSKMVRAAPGGRHLCYCYSPPRYLWDLHETYLRDARGLQRLAFAATAAPLRGLDRYSARRVDRFVGISACVSERIKRWYGRESEVVYPPVAAKAAGAGITPPMGDYLLSLGRLVSYKRVDLAIEAAERLGVRLIVAGDGPDRARLERLAGPHTEFLGEVNEAYAGALLEGCRAFVFCAEEDFGIAPVEANAHGRPVVAYGVAGVLETMVGGITAELFSEPTVAGAAAAITRTLERSWDPEALRRNARRFAPEVFRAGLVREAERALGGAR